jgi:hypothetical protein
VQAAIGMGDVQRGHADPSGLILQRGCRFASEQLD